jgi:REP element-mobilizing transposase RayT
MIISISTVMRTKHVQQDLVFARRGGKRKGAGRPARGPRPSERHKQRPHLRASHPVHVTIRTSPRVGSLRRLDKYRALRHALITTFTRDGFRIVHLSIQRTHVHLLVEATGRMTLARGMQAFQISAARLLNRIAHRNGSVFTDRYHAVALTSPRRVRNALGYVLNNWRRHRERTATRIDPYSSASSFDGWSRPVEPADDPLPVWRPKTWLLSEGWRRHGRIDPTACPLAASHRDRFGS